MRLGHFSAMTLHMEVLIEAQAEEAETPDLVSHMEVPLHVTSFRGVRSWMQGPIMQTLQEAG